MEDKNIRINLQIKQLNQSNILGYDERYISGSSNYNFALLDFIKLILALPSLKSVGTGTKVCRNEDTIEM